MEKRGEGKRWVVDFGQLGNGVRLAIAIAVTCAVAALAWLVGGDDPVPAWISEGLVPALGWIYLALLVVAGLHVLRRRRASVEHKEDEKR